MSELDLSLESPDSEAADRMNESFKQHGQLALSPTKSIPVVIRKGEMMHEAVERTRENAKMVEQNARKRLLEILQDYL